MYGAYYCAGAGIPEEVQFAMYVTNLVSCWACRAKERDDVSIGILKLFHDSDKKDVGGGNVEPYQDVMGAVARQPAVEGAIRRAKYSGTLESR